MHRLTNSDGDGKQAMQARRIQHQTQFSRWAIAKQLMIDDARGREIEHPPVRNCLCFASWLNLY